MNALIDQHPQHYAGGINRRRSQGHHLVDLPPVDQTIQQPECLVKLAIQSRTHGNIAENIHAKMTPEREVILGAQISCQVPRPKHI